jgi:uncharacterized membrane protein
VNELRDVRAALEGLRERQTAAEAALTAYEAQDLPQENARLRELVESLHSRLQDSRSETEALQKQYQKLSSDFKDELTLKRLSLLGVSQRRHMEYLTAGLAKEQARIIALEEQFRQAVDKISFTLDRLDTGEIEPLRTELDELSRRVMNQVEKSRARREETWMNVASGQAGGFRAVQEEPVQDAALQALRKYFQWETFLGLKILSAVGALLILLGVFTFGRFLYIRMSAAFQCAVIFALGLLLMGAGEALFRKKWRGGFTRALTAGGSGILFLGAALGYRTLGVLPMGAALGLCAGAAVLTFCAALRTNSQLVAAFSLIGGYLPLLIVSSPLLTFYPLYFTVFNLFVLILATRRRWQTTRFIGLTAGLLAEFVMILSGLRASLFGAGAPVQSAGTAWVGAAIAVGTAAYLIIPVFGVREAAKRVSAQDILLLSCNVFFRFLMAQFWAGRAALNGAYIALFFAVCCVAMAFLTERLKDSGVSERDTGALRSLFFITSVTFFSLIALYALDRVWYSFGWLIEAAGLAMIGIFQNRRRFNIAAVAVGICCLASFLAVNLPGWREPIFVWQYLSVTLAAAAVALATLKRKPNETSVHYLLNVFRGAAAFNVWLFLVYALHVPLAPALLRRFGVQGGLTAALLSMTLGFAFSFLLPRARRIYNGGFQAAAIMTGAISTLWLLGFNAVSRDLTGRGTAVIVFVMFVIINLIGIGWFADFLRFLTGLRKLPLRWFALLVSGYAVLLALQNLVVQLSLKPSSLILTLVFGLTALGWVIFGFVKRSGVTRISGLAMAFFTVLKLFVLDLYGLDTTWRIVSYFTGGVVLLAISFAYQWFSKRLEQQEEKR